MATVSFLNLPLLVRRGFIDYPYFANLAMLQNVAAVREQGWDVRVLDAFAQGQSGIFPFNRGYHIGCLLRDYLAALESLPLDLVVIAGNPFLKVDRKQVYVRQVLERIKALRPDSVIILADCYVGGMHYIDYAPEAVFRANPEVDYIVKYHGEAVLPTLVPKIFNDSSARVTRDSERVFIGKARDILFDDLPHPAWEEISIKHYFSFLSRGFKTLGSNPVVSMTERTLPILTSRGCVFSCVFCSSNPDERGDGRRTHLLHSLDYLKDQIAWLQEGIGVDHLVLLDEIANLHAERFEELIDFLNGRFLTYAIPNGLRADRLTRRVLAKMRGRLKTLSTSAESGDKYVLREIVKGKSKPGAIGQVADWCKELGMPLLIHYMIGFPGEKEEQINRTLFDALRMNREYGAEISLQYATPLPGTELHEIVRRRGLLSNHEWHDYSEFFTKQPMIQGEVDRVKLMLFKQNFELALNTKTTKKIIVNMTYKCNNYCIFCATGDMPHVDADAEKIRLRLGEAYARGVRLLDLDGGEPTLHPELFDVIRFARNLGYEYINLTTNGRLLSYPDFAVKTVRSGIHSLLISIHGHTQELHRRSTSEPDSFQQTVAGIRSALKYRPKHLRIGANITLTKLNYVYLPGYVEFIYDLGIRIVNIQFLTPFGRATAAMLPPMQEATSLVKKVIEAYQGRMRINIANLQPCFLPGYESYALADFAKSERTMLFCTDQSANLSQYLGKKRIKTKECSSCPYSIVCQGFYDFDSPESNLSLQGIADPGSYSARQAAREVALKK